jgi:small subunit ribosomal protein S2
VILVAIGHILERKMSESLTIRDLLQVGAHYGHKTRYWNPKMARYIYCEHKKVHILDLSMTLTALEEAANLVGRVVSNRGKVLFVGTKYAAQDAMREAAQRCDMPYVNYRWLGGMLTNYKTVRQSIRRLKDLEQQSEEGIFQRLTKKEGLNKMREMEKLERSLGGIKNMGGLPDVLFVVDITNEKIAINEAKRLGIPVIGVVDTNACPDGIDYVIPANDDAARAIRLYAGLMADAALAAKEILSARSTTTVVESKKLKKVKAENGNATANDSVATQTEAADLNVEEGPTAPKSVPKDDAAALQAKDGD